MKKILVIGSGGAGKSTFARRLGAIMELPVIHLDQHYWRPNWIETPKPEWRIHVESLIREDQWIIDGNFSGTLSLRLAACDTAIFLDLPRHICLWRVCKRILTSRAGSRPDMAPGCNEKFDLEFLLWIWNYRKVSRPKIESRLADFAERKRVIRLTRPAEVEDFLSQLSRGEGLP